MFLRIWVFGYICTTFTIRLKNKDMKLFPLKRQTVCGLSLVKWDLHNECKMQTFWAHYTSSKLGQASLYFELFKQIRGGGRRKKH